MSQFGSKYSFTNYPSMPQSVDCYPDTRASHHITPDLSSLSIGGSKLSLDEAKKI